MIKKYDFKNFKNLENIVIKFYFSKIKYYKMESEKTSDINYDYIDQSLLTVENVENILLTISPELFNLSYVTYDYPNNEEILNHKYSIINIKQFFGKIKQEEMNIDLNDDLNDINILKTSFSDDSIGHFIIIINNYPTCIVYPLYYINCIGLEEYLKDKCNFKNVVWNYNIIQHGNSSSCGWLCCKIAYDYFVKNNIEVECRDYIIQNF